MEFAFLMSTSPSEIESTVNRLYSVFEEEVSEAAEAVVVLEPDSEDEKFVVPEESGAGDAVSETDDDNRELPDDKSTEASLPDDDWVQPEDTTGITYNKQIASKNLPAVNKLKLPFLNIYNQQFLRELIVTLIGV